MRCMSFFNNNKNDRARCRSFCLSLRQLLVICLAGFFSFSAMIADAQNSAVVARSAHATHLIQDYLSTQGAEIEAIEQTQDDTLTELDQLQQLSNEQLTQKVEQTQPQEALLPTVFPVRSPDLTPGKVASKKIEVNLPQPIFIVGDDAQSKSWLEQYQKRLAKLHAKGYVVNVSSQEAMNALIDVFQPLSLMAIPGDSLAKTLGITHYPVLISDQLIEQ